MISPNIVIMTQAELDAVKHDAFRQGVERGIIEATTPQRCHASRGDGECNWTLCPQNREGEPMKSGRHCPLDAHDDED